jgi:hypothetical protein
MSATQFFLPYQAATINAIAEPGATLTFYLTGTTTKLPIYSTALLDTELANPIRANAAGRFADIYLDSTQTYRLLIKDRNGTALEDFDPFVPGTVIGFPSDTDFRVTPQMYGAEADGVTDDSAAFVAAIAYLRGLALNTGGGGFYKGSPKLFVPAGHYYMGTTAIDINHTLIIEGEGSGQLGPGAGGCTRLRWAAGSNGIRVQGANTNGNTGVDTDPNTHDGAGGVVLRDLCLQGGYVATEGEYHGLVVRNAVKAENLYIKNWQGDGVKAWAGTVSAVNYGGNVSTMLLVGVKSEGNRIGFDVRGSDANGVTLINCEGYQNRQAGYIGDNGAGANTVQGMHCASNGVIADATPTQCTSSSKYYAAVWGGDFTVAPSGTTADTANWFYVGAGSVDSSHPAHTATPNTFRAGGDYVTINSDSTTFVVPYSEGNGFSQFNHQALILNPTMLSAQHRGGSVILALSDGLRIRLSAANPLRLESRNGETGVWALDPAGTVFGYVDFIQSGPALVNGDTGVQLRQAGSAIASATTDGLGYPNSLAIGGAVTQATDKSTGVTLSKVCGQITMNGAALAGGAKVSFAVTNSKVVGTDTVIVSVASGGTANAYRAAVTAVGAASFTVTVENITGGSLSEAPVINFAVIKAVAA